MFSAQHNYQPNNSKSLIFNNENFEFEIMKGEKDKLEKQLLDTIVKMHELESEVALTTSEREKLSNELSNIKMRLKEGSNTSEGSNQDIRKQIDYLSNENVDLNKQNRILNEELNSFRIRNNSLEDRFKGKEMEQEKIASTLKNTISDLKKYIFQLEESNKQLSKATPISIGSNERELSLEKIIEGLRSQMKLQSQEIKRLKLNETQNLTELESCRDQLKETEQIGFEEISTISSRYKTELEDNLKIAKAEFRKEIERRDRDLDSICNENDELNNEILELREENQTIKRQLKSLAMKPLDNYTSPSKDISQLKTQLKNLESSHKEHIEKLRTIHSKEKADLQRKGSPSNNKESNYSIFLLYTEIERLHGIINDLEEETSFCTAKGDLNKSKDFIIMDLTKKIKGMETELERVNSILIDRCEGIYREMY